MGVLGKASLFRWYALAALAGDFALLRLVHRSKSAVGFLAVTSHDDEFLSRKRVAPSRTGTPPSSPRSRGHNGGNGLPVPAWHLVFSKLCLRRRELLGTIVRRAGSSRRLIRCRIGPKRRVPKARSDRTFARARGLRTGAARCAQGRRRERFHRRAVRDGPASFRKDARSRYRRAFLACLRF